MNVLLTAKEARALLQPVALWMHSVENRREVERREILEYITPLLQRLKVGAAPEELLASWQERSGIFKGEGEVYFFHHLSFQEYLTAEQIRNQRAFEILVKSFDQAWWREPTLLAMGLTDPAIFADFMAVLLRDKPLDGAGRDFMRRCIAEALVKDEAPFVEALRRLPSAEARYSALFGMATIATTAAQSAVKEVLQDKEPGLAQAARSILAQWGEKPAAPPSETKTVVVKGKRINLPARRFNFAELNAEYILIAGATESIVLQSTKKTAPEYPVYFAKYPVTNKFYRRFIAYLASETKEEVMKVLPRQEFAQSLLARAKEVDGFMEYLGKDSSQWAGKLRSRYDDEKRFNDDSQPAAGVSWFGAAAYCHWLSELQKANSKEKNETFVYRLPSEEEWEWAASGGKREYPWGKEQPDDTRANYGEKVGHTTPVGAYPAGATPEGLMDMAGNVWEWMHNSYGLKELPEARALRGGSWYITSDYLRCAARNGVHPDSQWLYDGFRVVCAQSFF